MPLAVTNPVDQAGYVTPKRVPEVLVGAIVPMGAVASGMTIATSTVRGTATGNAVAATIEAGVTIANLGSDGAAPAPATVDVTTGMHRGAVTPVDLTAVVMPSGSVTISGSATISGSVMTSVTAMATAAGMSETSGNVGIAISTRTSVAVSVRGVSVPPGGIGRNIHTVAATMSVAAVMIADLGKGAASSANRVTSIPSNKIR